MNGLNIQKCDNVILGGVAFFVAAGSIQIGGKLVNGKRLHQTCQQEPNRERLLFC